MIVTHSVKRELVFPQSREKVWHSLTNRDSLADWMFPNDFEPRVGHRFTFRVPPNPKVKFDGLIVQCEVLKCVPPEELSFTWVAAEVNTQVHYRLEVEGTGTRVYFEHSGFEQMPAYKGAEYGWNMMFEKWTELISKIFQA